MGVDRRDSLHVDGFVMFRSSRGIRRHPPVGLFLFTRFETALLFGMSNKRTPSWVPFGLDFYAYSHLLSRIHFKGTLLHLWLVVH